MRDMEIIMNNNQTVLTLTIYKLTMTHTKAHNQAIIKSFLAFDTSNINYDIKSYLEIAKSQNGLIKMCIKMKGVDQNVFTIC